jgi:hypothetical protein
MGDYSHEYLQTACAEVRLIIASFMVIGGIRRGKAPPPNRLRSPVMRGRVYHQRGVDRAATPLVKPMAWG